MEHKYKQTLVTDHKRGLDVPYVNCCLESGPQPGADSVRNREMCLWTLYLPFIFLIAGIVTAIALIYFYYV